MPAQTAEVSDARAMRGTEQLEGGLRAYISFVAIMAGIAGKSRY